MGKVKEYYINKIVKIPSNDPKFGGSNGKVYSDGKYARARQRVTGLRVTIWSGLVNSIQFIYNNDRSLSTCYGSGEGTLIERSFAEDEYITEFSWISGWNHYYCSKTSSAFTWNIRVTTNYYCYEFGEEPSSYYCGDKKRYTIKADEGARIVGIRCKARCSDKDAQPGDKPGTYGKILNTLYAISDVYECWLDDKVTEGDIYYNDYYNAIHAQKMTEVRGATFGNCINRLQFVYDNDYSLTSMHGVAIAGETPFSLKVNEDKPLTRMVFVTAESDQSQYGDSPFLTYLQLGDDKKNSVGKSSESLPLFYHKHEHELKTAEGKELWAFSGLFNKYMGSFMSYYERDIPMNNLKDALVENSTENDILVINVRGKNNKGDTEDSKVGVLIDNWNAWYGADDRSWKAMYGNNAVKNLRNCDFLPAKSGTQPVLCTITGQTIKDVICSKQYKYITFHCHGYYTFVGNQVQLVDSKWVLENKGKVEDIIFNFNCCECGVRGTGSYTKNSGLAVSMISQKAKAAFGYTIALEISPKKLYYNKNTGGSVEEDKRAKRFYYLCLRFAGAVDKAYFEGEKSVNKVAELAKNEFKSILDDIVTGFCLQKDMINSCLDDYLKEIQNKNYKAITEKIFFPGGTEEKIMQKIREKGIKDGQLLAYSLYFQVYFALQHFVGPGDKAPNGNLRKKNLGELCDEYGNDGWNPDL